LYELDESTQSYPVEQEDIKPMPPGNSWSSNPMDDEVPSLWESQMLY